MATRRAETILVGAGAALLMWGMWRAVARGEPATKAWTSYAMIAMVVVTALNIFARKPAIAIACGVLCALFLAMVLLAASLGAQQDAPNRIPAILRAASFFVLIGLASLLQAISSRSSALSESRIASPEPPV